MNNANIPHALQAAVQHHQNGQFAQAQALYRQILQTDPAQPDALQLLGLIEHQQGHSAVAVDLIKRAIRFRPQAAMYHFNLGNTLRDMGRLEEAASSFRKAISLEPNFPDASCNLGNALRDLGQLDAAIISYQQALFFKPDFNLVFANLSLVYLAQGRSDESVNCYRRGLEFWPDDIVLRSSLLLTLQYASNCSPAELFDEHLRYAERFEAPLKPFWRPHPNSREPGRRLKVGYVSGDFREHPVAYFIEPILANHNKAAVEVYGYYNNTVRDPYTERIASHMDHWLDCSDLSDDQLAQRIRLDAIDILVDLSGHTAHNRLPVFARKPAPVQVNYIGYPGSTGLSAIDYRVSDPWQDPVGLTERYHSETLVRIPGGMAFQPAPGAPAVNALPALTAGEFMLASFNNLRKVTPAVIHLWARILHALPQARLMLGNAADSGIRERLIGLFAQAGVDGQRLILQPKVSMADYLALHHQIDLALDPFPFNGGTTTMDSLWMGVPVITLAGDHAASRLSTAHLSRVDLPEFICQTEEAYVQCAIRFANDLPALNAVRQSLRARMTAPKCQPATITRQLEAAYRDMWRTWCNL